MPNSEFPEVKRSSTQPAESGVAITKSDTETLATTTRGLSIAVTGTISVTMANGEIIQPYLAAGIIHPIRVKKVWSTGTDAGITAIIGWY